MGNGRGWTLTTNRQNGLQNVCEDLFLKVKHRFCVRHMYTNFFNVGYKRKTLNNFVWHVAKSTTIAEYKLWMEKIHEVNVHMGSYKEASSGMESITFFNAFEDRHFIVQQV